MEYQINNGGGNWIEPGREETGAKRHKGKFKGDVSVGHGYVGVFFFIMVHNWKV